ncbi:MAG: hypothetical protein BGO96_03105 [Micrococcales bacterium 73-15]|uniref:copper resistance CopC family protein n=1 Tax=Salana multivorans TaxID=120377 RepID=UPI00095F5E19|nr:copper resistance CopC family protein [Salana multivorans]OJX97050.1 MAG: hypothetical protein BGO96_03105 [Micrococcales bacterium 73-15]
MSPRARLVGALAPLLLLLGWVAAPALAHDTLLASTPVDGGVVDRIPTEVVLEMSATAMELGTEVQVLDAAGTNVVAGDPIIDDRFVSTPVAIASAGDYSVVWHVTSSDGHPIEGTFSFTVPESVLPVEPTPTPSETPSAQESATPSETASAAPSTAAPSTAEASTTATEASDEASAAPSPSESSPSDSGSGTPVALIVILVAVVAVLASLWWLRARRGAAAGDAGPTDAGGAPRG